MHFDVLDTESTFLNCGKFTESDVMVAMLTLNRLWCITSLIALAVTIFHHSTNLFYPYLHHADALTANYYLSKGEHFDLTQKESGMFMSFSVFFLCLVDIRHCNLGVNKTPFHDTQDCSYQSQTV